MIIDVDKDIVIDDDPARGIVVKVPRASVYNLGTSSSDDETQTDSCTTCTKWEHLAKDRYVEIKQ